MIIFIIIATRRSSPGLWTKPFKSRTRTHPHLNSLSSSSSSNGFFLSWIATCFIQKGIQHGEHLASRSRAAAWFGSELKAMETTKAAWKRNHTVSVRRRLSLLTFPTRQYSMEWGDRVILHRHQQSPSSRRMIHQRHDRKQRHESQFYFYIFSHAHRGMFHPSIPFTGSAAVVSFCGFIVSMFILAHAPSSLACPRAGSTIWRLHRGRRILPRIIGADKWLAGRSPVEQAYLYMEPGDGNSGGEDFDAHRFISSSLVFGQLLGSWCLVGIA
jgi:hypothetical protein